MRVDFTNFGSEPPEKSKPGRAAVNGTAASPPGATNDVDTSSSPGADSARFSFDPSRVRSLAEQAMAAPEIRQDKVEPLQQAVASGEYTVDAAKVADAIAAEAGNGRIR